MLRTAFLLFLTLFIVESSLAQIEQRSEVGTPIKEVLDLFKKEDTSKVPKPEKNKMFLALPTFGHQPAFGYTFGILTRFAFRKKPENKYSSLTAGGSYSTKKQLLTYFQNNMYLGNDKFFLSGDWRYYIFSQSNYGLGSDIIPASALKSNFDLASIEEPMKYNYLKIHQTISYNIAPSFYVGAGIHIDSYSDIKDELLDVANEKYTEHYLYNKRHGFDLENYTVSGFSVNGIYDSRDNIINTNKGLYVNLNYRHNPSFLNQHSAETILAETRYFIPLSKKNNQHVLAFWSYGYFLLRGQLPYLNLPALGWDQSSRSGKGYIQGLIRGNTLAYMEGEYRFPIMKNQLISGTLFANVTSASDADRNLKLFAFFQPAAGVGLRILLDKATMTNFIINYGRGRNSNTFYFNDGESF